MRPRKFNTPDEMQKVIDKYFEDCDNATTYIMTLDGAQKVSSPENYTIEGLCIALGMTRMSLINYGEREGYEEYFDTVARAKKKVFTAIDDRLADILEATFY